MTKQDDLERSWNCADSFRLLISEARYDVFSQTWRYCGGEDGGSSLSQIHLFILHEVIWIIAILQRKV